MYTIINRSVRHSLGIDGITFSVKTKTYDEIKKIFNKEKEYYLKLVNNNKAIIIRDEDNIFCIKSNNSGVYEYIKVLDLCLKI